MPVKPRSKAEPQDLHAYRRGVGRVRRFDSQLPAVPISTRMRLALQDIADAADVSVAAVARQALSAYTGIEAEEPNADNVEEMK